MQEKAEQIFLGQLETNQMKYAEKHKTAQSNIVPLVAFFKQAFFKQCHNANQVSEMLEKLNKEKESHMDYKRALTMRDQGRKKHAYCETHGIS